ncbi:hypothetical protein GCM10009605_28860 [Nocardiopsis composta]
MHWSINRLPGLMVIEEARMTPKAMTRTMNNPTAIASLVTQDPPLLEGSFTKGESIPSPARG